MPRQDDPEGELRKLTVRFFRTDSGNEPVLELLRSMDAQDKKILGKDIYKLELGGVAIGRPTVGFVEDGLYEIRSTLCRGEKEFRILFIVEGNEALLLHAFYKKTSKLQKRDIDLAKERRKRALSRS